MLGRHPLGQANRRDRLQQREERAAEESRLLAGDDRDAQRIAQPRGRGERIRRRAAPALLRQRIVGDALAVARMALRARDGVAPRRRIRGIAGEELRHARVVERVVGGEPLDPRKPANLDGKARRRWSAAAHRVWGSTGEVLSQSARAECQGRRVLRFDADLATAWDLTSA